MIILKLCIAILVFLTLNWAGYMLTDKWDDRPEWLNYKPWNCRLCLVFWLNMAAAAFFLIMGVVWTAAGVAVLGVMNAAAMWLNQRNKTIRPDEWENIKRRKGIR